MNHQPEMLSADRHRLLKEHLMSEIARHVEEPRPRRRLVWLVASPLAVGALAAVSLVVPGRHADRPTLVAPAASAPVTPARSTAPEPEPTDAAGLLARAVKAAENRPDPKAKAGQFTFRKEVEEGADQPSHERKIWTSVDGWSSGLMEDSAMSWPGGAPARSEWPAPLGAAQGAPTVPSFDSPTYEFVAKLPTDPQQLLHRLLYDETKYAAPAMTDELRPQAAFSHVQFIFQNVTANPPTAGALMQAASMIPGTTLVADEADAAGRRGVALVHDVGSIRVSLIFDSKTGAFLGVHEVMLKTLVSNGPNGEPPTSSPRPGTVQGDVFATAVLQESIVDHAGDEPRS